MPLSFLLPNSIQRVRLHRRASLAYQLIILRRLLVRNGCRLLPHLPSINPCKTGPNPPDGHCSLDSGLAHRLANHYASPVGPLFPVPDASFFMQLAAVFLVVGTCGRRRRRRTVASCRNPIPCVPAALRGRGLVSVIGGGGILVCILSLL